MRAAVRPVQGIRGDLRQIGDDERDALARPILEQKGTRIQVARDSPRRDGPPDRCLRVQPRRGCDVGPAESRPQPG